MMEINSYYRIILLVGAILSLLLSMYLLFYPSKFYANKVLGALAFSWSITVFGFMIQSPGFFTRYPHLYLSLDFFTLLLFPLMYIYLISYLYADSRKISKHFAHLIPGFLSFVAFVPFFIQDAETKIKMITEEMPTWISNLQMFFNIVIICQGIFYTVLSLRKLHHFQYFRKSRLSNYQIASIYWLRLFITINMVLWAIGTAGVFSDIFGFKFAVDLFALFYLGLTVLTLVLIAFTIQRPEFFSEDEDIAMLAISKTGKANQERKIEVRHLTSEIEILVNHIEHEKAYLKPDLKMQDLVEATGLSSKRISEIFNNDLKKSFFDLINDYRMKTVFELIKDGFHKKHTIPHLAEKAGFNSKTSFNRIFKKYTGQTPSEYIKDKQFD